MKKKGEIQRKRIIIYYVLAIVLPCLILGILAFRGIKNDQALVEREQRRNLLEAGQQIIQDTDAYLTSIEASFTELIDSVAIPQRTIFRDSILKRFSDQYNAIAGIFFLSGTGAPLLLNNGMLFVPDDLLTDTDVAGSQTTQDILEKGWQYEYREHNYRKALEYYQNVLGNVTGGQSGGEILNTIARIQKKLKLNDKAIETYDLIWHDYPQVLIQKKIPLGAVALLEKSLLYLEKKDTLAALQNVRLLLSQIQKPLWELGYSHYANFISKIDEIISRCESSHYEETGQWLQRIQSVKDSLSLSEKHTEYLLSFLGNSDLISGNTVPGLEIHNRRNKTRINGKSYLFSLIPGNDQGHWGLIMDNDHILHDTIHPLILKNANGSDFYWELTGINGELLLKSDYIPEDTPPVYSAFPSNLPSWSLTIYPEEPGLFVSLFRTGKGLFFYIFIVILIILAFGLFFTLQTVNNELHLSRMKSYFMSTVSHEFKSPLTSIRQMAEMLVHGRVPSPDRQQKYYTTILQQSERLSHLIDNILDFSKMEEGQKIFRFETADITPVVKEMVESFQKITADEGFLISLSITEPLPDVVFDHEAMEQVIHNLIDNACKYSGESRTIEVQLYPEGNKIVLSVRDQGVGIRKEDQEKIFSRFYRAGEELTQAVKGSGIGLTIVKQIVESHQGEVTVESNPGKGSIFNVILPISQK
jgi:signal transduction histidine kinase/tetratricopeptide (TPR) repeat protein